MDHLSTKWISELPELEMDDSDDFNMDQWQNLNGIEKQIKPWKLQIQTSNDQKLPSSSSSSTIISFANPSLPSAAVSYDTNSSSVSEIYLGNASLEFEDGVRKGPTRNAAQAQDHVLAERKRRERMTERFVALSGIVPGLKKLDKATVLGGAIKYIKELQERVTKLEQTTKRNNINDEEESIVAVKRARLISCNNNNNNNNKEEEEGYSSDETFCSSSEQSSSLHDIEVKASEENVLVRVYCKNQKGIFKEILSETERHHLTMISSSVMPFGDNRLHITIISQISADHKLTAKILEDNLRTLILNHI